MKHDGYRILARLDHGRVRLLSRNGRDWSDKFPTIAEAVGRLPAERALLDGEVAVLQPDGTTSFQALQNFLSGTGPGQLVYMVFDLLHLDGWDLTGARLEDRKAVLERLLASGNGKSGPVRYSDHVAGDGPDFFTHGCRLGLEGVIAKRRDAPYRSTRGADWLKIKCVKRQEVVIGGYTDPEGSRIGIGALLVGLYGDGRLVYAGKVGTGFGQKTLRALKKRLAPLEQKACPFATCPTGVGRPHWVKPELVAEVSFSEWTADGKMRHPSFQGLREDKPATSVVRELPSRVEEVVKMPASSTNRSPTGSCRISRAGRRRSSAAPRASPRNASIRSTSPPGHPRACGESRSGRRRRWASTSSSILFPPSSGSCSSASSRSTPGTPSSSTSSARTASYSTSIPAPGSFGRA